MGKGAAGGAVELYDYYGSIAGAVCNGPVDELLAIIVDGVEVWPRARAWRLGVSIPNNVLRSIGGRTWRSLQAHTSSVSNIPPNPSYWEAYAFQRVGDYDDITVGNYGQVRIYWGTQTQTQDSELAAAGNDFAEDHPAYKGVCYVILKGFLFGRERVSAPNVEVIIGRKPDQSIITSDAADLDDGQANLAACAAELLTSQIGAGFADADLDTTSFQAAADYLLDESGKYDGSPLLTAQNSLQSFLQDLANMSDLWFWYNPTTSKIEAGVFHHGDQDFSPTTFGPEDLTEPPSYQAQGMPELKTRAVVNFADRTRAYKTSSDKADDIRAFQIIGQHRAITLNRPHVTRRQQALACAAETLRSIGRPQITGQVSVRREQGRTVTPGAYVRLDIDLEPGGSQLLQIFKVLERSIPPAGPIRLEVDADESIYPIPYNPGDTLVEEDEPEVATVDYARIFEPPTPLGLDGLALLVERPDRLTTSYSLWYDNDPVGSFVRLGASVGFATRGALTSDITATGTTIQVTIPDQADESRMEEQPGAVAAADDELILLLFKTSGGAIVEQSNGWAYMEICSISAQTLVSGTNYDLTVLRGRRGTTGLAFLAADTEAWIIPRASLNGFEHLEFAELRLNALRGDTPDTGYFRIVPRTYVAELDLADASNISFQWPTAEASAPSLDLSAPASEPVSVSSPYPQNVDITGNWFDVDGDFVSWTVHLQESGGDEVLVASGQVTPRASAAMDVDVAIEGPATWYIIIRGYDALGFVYERTVEVNATGATAKTAAPTFWFFGEELVWDDYVLCGPVELRSQNPDATIEWRVRWYDGLGAAWESFSSWYTYAWDGGSTSTPFIRGSGWKWPGTKRATKYEYEARATAPGMLVSDTTKRTFHEDYTGF